MFLTIKVKKYYHFHLIGVLLKLPVSRRKLAQERNLTPVTSIICIPLHFAVLGKRDTWKRRRQMTNVTLGSGGWVAIK